MSRTTSGPRVTIENGVHAARERADACPREPEAPFGGLVRIGCRTERDLLLLPGPAGELAAEDLCDVRLHADRAPVLVAGGAVRALLEVADVAERAAVRRSPCTG